MDDLFDRLAGVALAAKLGAVIGLIVAMCGIYYMNFYSDIVDQIHNLEQEQARLKQERADYEKRKREYLAFRNEVNALLEEQKELLRVLPKADDIEQFIESVQAQIELAGLSKVASVREVAVPVEMYMKIPVKMQLLDSYHQINRFFKNVGDLKRIVNIEDLALTPNAEGDKPLTGPLILRANFVATTFQFLDKSSKTGGAARNVTSVSATGAQ